MTVSLKLWGKSRVRGSGTRYDVPMRRTHLFALVFTIVFIALPQVTHAAIPFFGPIIPSGSGTCPASWGLVITVINNIISFLLTLLIVFVMPIMLAYGGFLYVVNPADPAARGKANKVLLNTIYGLIVALSSWLVVDAIMAVLYNPGAGSLGTWSSLISSGGVPVCLPQAGTGAGAGLNQATTTPPVSVTPGAGGAGKFTFDPGIDAQVSTQSGALTTLLSCMAGKVPAGVGRISSISDSKITSGQYTFRQCATQGSTICAHTVNSCHYGGSGRCNGESYAVDFGDEQNTAALTAAAQACDGVVLNEGNHLHISVGARSGCGCDTRL